MWGGITDLKLEIEVKDMVNISRRVWSEVGGPMSNSREIQQLMAGWKRISPQRRLRRNEHRRIKEARNV